MTRAASVLRAVDSAPAELVALANDIYGRLRSVEANKRAPKALDDVRYRATLLALVRAIATIALSQVPPRDGISVAFSEGKYIDSPISPTALRKIRNGLSALGLIVIKKGFHSRDGGDSFVTGIRHTTEFTALAREHGVSLNALIDAPTEVVALKGSHAGEIPHDVVESASVVRRYNSFISSFQLTLPGDAWADLVRLIVKGGTNGKGDKLHRGYGDARIFLTRRFSGSYERGGRLYDGFWQNMPKAIRKRLLIDGELTAELDYRRIHPTILFAEAGIPMDRDPYLVPGYEELEVAGKRTFNRLLNGRGVVRMAKADRQWFADAKEFNRYRDAMIDHLAPIADQFQKDRGARLQKVDSDLALVVINRCIDRGIPVYPIHDSFIVRTQCVDQTYKIMTDAFSDSYGSFVGISIE